MPNERETQAREIAARLFADASPNPPASNVGVPESATELTRVIIEHCFTDSWARPGLDFRTKSIITLSFLTALGGAPLELNRHVHAALTNGVTKEEIVELFIHAAAYCGAPRANGAFAIAREVFAERE
jgi:4-carboxymuconolactone decarboxylase